MKKTVKRIALLLAAVSLVLCLCGCDALDEMRENQAFWGENSEILWNGSVYKKMPVGGYLYVETDASTSVHVTQPDVPVLLSVFEYACYPGEDGLFLEDMYGTYYCREDRYQEMLDRFYAHFQPDLICYSYYVYDSNAWNPETKYYTLTQEQVDMLTLVVENEEPTVLGEGWYLRVDLRLALWECSEDMLFRRNSMDIARSGSTYYLYLYTDQNTYVFTIPSGCNDTCKEIIKAYETRYEEITDDGSAESV